MNSVVALHKLENRIRTSNSLLCVGLDSDFSKLPDKFCLGETPQFDFNKFIIDSTQEFVCAYKPNMAFYEARGEQGMHELRLTMEYLRGNFPDIYTICDAKRADIGNTNFGYVASIFDDLGFDAITLHPYLGSEALAPFLKRKDKNSIILCRTSNPGAGELQDLVVGELPLWEAIASRVQENWNANHNCMLVVGATYPDEMKRIRKLCPDLFFLVPGIGAQGGEVAATISAGKRADGSGLIVSVSRSIIFADDCATQARILRDEINLHRSSLT